MRDKHIFLLYISSSSVKKRHYKKMSLFIKIMIRNYETCPVITPKSIFFEGVITGYHFWRYRAVVPETDFTFWKFITCLPLLPKQIKQNIILKTQNQDFPRGEIEYVITLLKWFVRLILFLILVGYRSNFKVVLTILRILFCKKQF